MYGKDYVNDKHLPLAIDHKSRTVPMVNFIHYMTHLGNVFNVSTKATVGAGADGYFLGKVGATAVHWNHYSIGADDGPLDIYLFEAPTISDNGTPMTVVNRNRESSNVSNFSVFAAPTVSADGTELFVNGVLASGTGPTLSAQESGDDTIWILAPNTDYIFKIHNDGAGTANVWAHFAWHEGITGTFV